MDLMMMSIIMMMRMRKNNFFVVQKVNHIVNNVTLFVEISVLK